MTKRKVLICGAAGFIGRNIAERVLGMEELEVYGTYLNSEPWSHPKLRMIKADLRNKEEVDRAVKGMDIIIQAAATTSGAKDIVTKPFYHVTDNTIMNALIFRAAYESRVSHLVFFSCTTMYQSSDAPVKETDFDANEEMHPSYFGGAWMKVYNEKMCDFYSRIGPTKFTVIRHSNIYGPYDKYDLEKSHVFGATVAKVMSAAEGGKIIVWGAGTEERDLLYQSDLVDFVILALERQKEKFSLFNAGSGVSISISDLVKKIISHSGKRINLEYDRTKPSIKTRLRLDITKAKKELGWSPRVSLDDGIRMTLDWYRANADTVKARVCSR